MLNKLLILSFLAISLSFGCNNSPKEISSDSKMLNDENATGIFSENNHSKTNKAHKLGVKNGVHTVVVKELLPASKYVYLKVEENGEEFWIAALNQDVKIGESYSYQGGLLKTNFESKEHNRVFDKVYLVSQIVPVNPGQTATTPKVKMDHQSNVKKDSSPKKEKRNIKIEGSTSIKAILDNPQKFEGKKIKVSGECVKLNPNIMGRNWIHLKDGSKDDYDFVVTSKNQVLEGSILTLEGTIILNKDFGAGYQYDLIMEDAEVIKK